MSRWHRDREQFERDRIIARFHPDYREIRFIDALAQLRRDRGEYV